MTGASKGWEIACFWGVGLSVASIPHFDIYAEVEVEYFWGVGLSVSLIPSFSYTEVKQQ